MAKCGGCEAKTAEINENGTLNPLGDKKAVRGPAFEGELAAEIFSTYLMEFTHTTVNGECDEDCEEATSCSYEIEVKLVGVASLSSADSVGPSLLLTPPVNSVLSSAGVAAPTMIPEGLAADQVAGHLFTMEWVWSLTVTPTCEVSSLDVTFTDDDFTIDAASSGGWSKVPSTGDKDVTLVLGCEPCDGTKLADATQSTGKNENTASITGTTLE